MTPDTPANKNTLACAIIGTIALCAGIAHAYITIRIGIFSVALGTIGLFLWLTAIIVVRKQIKTFFAVYGIGRHSRAVLMAMLIITAFVLVNYLAITFDVRWDVTAAKQHTIGAQTRAILDAIPRTAKITVLYTGIPPTYIEDLLSEYRRLSRGTIETEIVDPIVNIGYAAQFGTVIESSARRAIIQSGGERQNIDFTDGMLTEALLTNAIVKATRDRRRICFTEGHEEYGIRDTGAQGLSIFNELLINNNCDTTTVMLGIAQAVPTDCDVLVIAGAGLPFTAEETSILEDYLMRGGKALFLIESLPLEAPESPLTERDMKRNPTFNEILNHWGLHIGDDIVIDLESHIGGDVGSPATKNYPKHDRIVTGLDYTFYIRPRSITTTTPRDSDIKTAPLVFTASKQNSWAETDTSLRVQFDAGVDIPGPVTIAAIVWGPKGDRRDDDTKIIIFTDADFVSNAFVAHYSNAQIALNSIGWLTETDNVMPIHVHTEEDVIERLDLTSKHIRIVTVILIAIPLLIALCGVAVFWLHAIR